MPLYEYLCEACGERFDLIQKFTDPAPDVCPKCGKGPVERQQSSPAIQFKGSGFYITDYARKGSTPAGEGSKSSPESSSSTSESGGDAKSGDSKSGDAKKGDAKKGDAKKADATPASTTTPSTTSEKS